MSTRSAVLGHALALGSKLGLEGVSIGALAELAGLSKSGLFSHFQSKEALQIAVLDEAVARFVDTVVAPSLRMPRGEPRVRALLDHWARWANAAFMPGGCVFVASIAEIDDKPGPVREHKPRRFAASYHGLDVHCAVRIAAGDDAASVSSATALARPSPGAASRC